MPPKYKNYPLADCVLRAGELVKQGLFVHQKFTCGKCGSRQTMGTANTFHKTGRCEECSHVTDISKTGCNYMVTTLSISDMIGGKGGE